MQEEHGSKKYSQVTNNDAFTEKGKEEKKLVYNLDLMSSKRVSAFIKMMSGANKSIVMLETQCGDGFNHFTDSIFSERDLSWLHLHRPFCFYFNLLQIKSLHQKWTADLQLIDLPFLANISDICAGLTKQTPNIHQK